MPIRDARNFSLSMRSVRDCLLAIGLVITLAIAGPTISEAQSASIDPFIGQWQGTGVSESEDALFFSMSSRDLDVTIQRSGNGFTVDWVTVMQTGDPNAPASERRESALSFRQTDTAGVYSATVSGNPLDGDPLAWARLAENALTITILEVTEDGGYALSNYERRLDEDGMKLTYYLLVDGETARTVDGRLSRID